METPVEIDFQDMQPIPVIRESIAAHVTGLEKRFGRIIACRVVIKGPTAHHRAGSPYEIHIHLALPDGREVVVAHTKAIDERQSDIAFAINDAFKRARRRLQDRVRRMQGHVKTHEPPPLGTVVRLDAAGGFGFLRTSDGREIYFHHNSVLDDAFPHLAIGTRVFFAEEAGDKGPQASTVRLSGKHSLR
jgi:cold shock CspA family protein